MFFIHYLYISYYIFIYVSEKNTFFWFKMFRYIVLIHRSIFINIYSLLSKCLIRLSFITSKLWWIILFTIKNYFLFCFNFFCCNFHSCEIFWFFWRMKCINTIFFAYKSLTDFNVILILVGVKFIILSLSVKDAVLSSFSSLKLFASPVLIGASIWFFIEFFNSTYYRYFTIKVTFISILIYIFILIHL